MDIETETHADLVVLRPGERLDVGTAPLLKQAVQSFFDAGRKRILLDLGRVEYVSSIGLSACLESAKRAQAEDGHIVMCGLGPQVAEVFDLTGITRLFEIHPDRNTARAALRDDLDLTLAEELVLLTLRDDGGAFVDLPRHALDFALAGAVLMDLCRRRRLDADASHLVVVDRAPVGDDILDPALAAAVSSGPRGVDFWIEVLTREAGAIRKRALDRLVARGILRQDNQLLRWVRGRRYPIADDREQVEVKQRVLSILRSEEIPGPHDVAVIALADACAVFDAILSMDEMLELRPRVAEVARMDLLAVFVARALHDAQRDDRRQHDHPLGIYGAATDVPTAG